MPNYPITGYIVAAGFGRDRDHSAFAAIDDRPPYRPPTRSPAPNSDRRRVSGRGKAAPFPGPCQRNPSGIAQWKEPAVEGDLFAPPFPAACGSKAVS